LAFSHWPLAKPKSKAKPDDSEHNAAERNPRMINAEGARTQKKIKGSPLMTQMKLSNAD